VVAAIRGPSTALIVAALLGLALLLLWQRARLGPGLRRALPAVLALLIAGALLSGFWQGGREPAADAAATDTLWQPFDAPAIATLVGEGRTVFVDVTADWCITCEVNKRLVLRQEAVVARLADPAVVAMRADWTRPDDGIARYLASFGRYGIPFNIVYGPAVPGGILLPELLDRDGVLAALDRARGG
jgi:suppressor for copper-sensitivity B